MKNMVYILLLSISTSIICMDNSKRESDLVKLKESGLDLKLVKAKPISSEKSPDAKEVLRVAQEVFGDEVPIFFTNIPDEKNEEDQGPYKAALYSDHILITELQRNITVLKMIFQGLKQEPPKVPIVFEFISR